MATKRLRRVTGDFSAVTPLTPPFFMNFTFYYTIDEHPEFPQQGPHALEPIFVQVQVQGNTTMSAAYSSARDAAETIMENAGLGGHTVSGG